MLIILREQEKPPTPLSFCRSLFASLKLYVFDAKLGAVQSSMNVLINIRR